MAVYQKNNVALKTSETVSRHAVADAMAVYQGPKNAAGEREGEGVMRFASGAAYDGEWRANMREGHGEMLYAGNEIYVGEWRTNQRSGKGTHRYANGSTYEGEWVAGKREGFGRYVFANGCIFEGEYRAGLRDGKGTFTFANGINQLCRFEGGQPVREGARWSSDHAGYPSTLEGRQVAWRLKDGLVVEGISLDEAEQIARRAGMQPPASVRKTEVPPGT